ncbi:PTS sugar transporter subunit IIA [Mycoplasma sp. U97]|uniref:PTS sugar transporter subunit IIA n=1 Tax=Mycoplasma tauri TaxID=547987 RepID=UPI001CBF9856|nr:PTS sugar transporter subunit IIA [Mycoplasma tauri]MBZ4212681.1 PTS sugar transporter subunit IIA [Mycoplasma tauri]
MAEKLNLLDNLIINDSIIVGYDAQDYKDAIHKACEPLVNKGVITYGYYDAIIKSTEAHGPYYILTDGLAMPHASATEDCVFSNGFSLVTLKKPIKFGDDPREVKIVMGLAAKDGETHTAVAIPQIIAVFEDPSNVDRIAAAKSKEEVIEIIKSVDYTKFMM